jgi:glycosyltransferase involved in cell wall biosynthesis
MGLRTPIVATRAGGNVEMLGADGSTAVLVEDGCAESFASALAELHADPERRRALAAAAYDRLITEFPLSLMIDRYDAMLQTIANVPLGSQ